MVGRKLDWLIESRMDRLIECLQMRAFIKCGRSLSEEWVDGELEIDLLGIQVGHILLQCVHTSLSLCLNTNTISIQHLACLQ